MADEMVERRSELQNYVTHREFSEFRQDIFTRFDQLYQELKRSQQPITAFAGWAAVILALVGAVVAPLMATDDRHEADILRHQDHLRQELNILREQDRNAVYVQGQHDERFDTLKEQIHAAIENRKDIDAKHLSRQEDLQRQMLAIQDDLRRQIDAVAHNLDNGFGRRIGEKLRPLAVEQNWLKRELGSDQ